MLQGTYHERKLKRLNRWNGGKTISKSRLAVTGTSYWGSLRVTKRREQGCSIYNGVPTVSQAKALVKMKAKELSHSCLLFSACLLVFHIVNIYILFVLYYEQFFFLCKTVVWPPMHCGLKTIHLIHERERESYSTFHILCACKATNFCQN